jgi:hypothetical protein
MGFLLEIGQISQVADETVWHAVVKLVEALCYKPEDHCFDSQCHWVFQLT